MDIFISEDAKLAVKRGINWLDENHSGWASRINLEDLDMGECEDCVIGQAVGDYTKITKKAAGVSSNDNYSAAAVWAVEHGFESPKVVTYQQATGDMSASYDYRALDTLWAEEVRSRLS